MSALSSRIKKLEMSVKPNEEHLIVIIPKGREIRQEDEFKTMEEYKKYLDSIEVKYVSVLL
ncbi:hypothetical protein [Pseudalkalibacillus decolorationis]|uniref:hypothetical protein n=1 Tax=Pseudalkalibacillus decolorationis TaxID=163879 RepID=UPI0021479290|nr:hypothetical protein [Pseudalkalibacillus decolorationis]